MKTPARNYGTAFIKIIIKRLKKHFKEGADVNMKNDNGVWFLLVASGHGNARMVNLLLEKGIDVNITNDYNNTALSNSSEKCKL